MRENSPEHCGFPALIILPGRGRGVEIAMISSRETRKPQDLE